MKLETFFTKFDELADTSGGAASLRKLVLNLAVRGGLVPNAPNEAAVPYESIEDATPINTDEVPSNWRVVLLADGIKNRSGNSKLIKGKLHEEPAPGRFQGFSASGADVWCDNYEHEGQAIIISAVGARCGKAFKASGRWSAIANTNIARLELTLFDFDFAYLVLNNEHFWVRGGSAQPFVKFPPSLDRHFALPPLAEQKRIVAKVDELMALCDRLEAQQQERETRHAALARASLARFADAPTPANLNLLFHKSYDIPPADLRKSILTLAVQGKLVPQDPNDEPAEELLGRIDSSRNVLLKAGIVPKQKPLADIGEAECQHSIPETWQWIRLQRAAEIIDPNPSHRMPRYCASGVPFISTENFVGREEIDFSIGKQVDDVQLEEQKQGFTIRPGSFALSRIGTIGKTRMLPLERNYCMSHALVVIAPYSEDIDPKFLRMVVSSDAVQGQASHGAKSIGVPDLGMGKIRSFVVPLPPLAEQRRIVAKVEQLMALVDALEQQLAASRATAANLLSALVAELTAMS